jgi:hypothetical protein
LQFKETDTGERVRGSARVHRKRERGRGRVQEIARESARERAWGWMDVCTQTKLIRNQKPNQVVVKT